MKKMISVEKMKSIEKWIKDNDEYFSDSINESALLQKLNLKLDYLDDDQFERDTEAVLCPSKDLSYNGLIKINKEYRETRFAYMHEIIHYLRDVGVGKKVVNIYTRKTKGNTFDEHEQEINYASAAAILKYDVIKNKLNCYDKSKPKMDELKFVNDICQEFHQDRTTVIRRLQEVRKLYKDELKKAK